MILLLLLTIIRHPTDNFNGAIIRIIRISDLATRTAVKTGLPRRRERRGDRNDLRRESGLGTVTRNPTWHSKDWDPSLPTQS
jgi:hypothetical protein